MYKYNTKYLVSCNTAKKVYSHKSEYSVKPGKQV